ncbi:MAG: hypothetical protein AAF790_11360 [Planctomycetota bacterium]
MLIAETLPNAGPDSIDLLAWAFVAAVLLGGPLLGYVFMVLDYRAYLRSLRRAIAVVRGYVTTQPAWVRRAAPPCLEALGLAMPCTREDVLAAYRERVKTMHPDAGGTRAQFARLQRHFEQAMSLVDPGG